VDEIIQFLEFARDQVRCSSAAKSLHQLLEARRLWLLLLLSVGLGLGLLGAHLLSVVATRKVVRAVLELGLG